MIRGWRGPGVTLAWLALTACASSSRSGSPPAATVAPASAPAASSTPTAPQASSEASPAAPQGEPVVLALPLFPGPGSVKLEEHRGKVILLDFWATWCGPCHEAARGYEALSQRYQGRDLEVLGVSVDDDTSDIPAFQREQGVTYPLFTDPGAHLSGPVFQFDALPWTVILDRGGRVRYSQSGFSDRVLGEETQLIDQLLAAPK